MSLCFGNTHITGMRKLLFSLGILAFFLVGLSGCGKKDPIALPVEHQDLLGVWEKVEVKDNGLVVDNLLLAFHQDNTVTYIACFKKPKSLSYTSLPGGNLVRFEGNQFDIQADFIFGAISERVTIDRFPYQSNGQTYLQVNGRTLRKLMGHEQSDYENWPCQKEQRESKSKDS